jgi:hypothetical protein
LPLIVYLLARALQLLNTSLDFFGGVGVTNVNELLRLVTFIYFGYVIWTMIRIKRENSDLQPPYEMYALLGSPAGLPKSTTRATVLPERSATKTAEAAGETKDDGEVKDDGEE